MGLEGKVGIALDEEGVGSFFVFFGQDAFEEACWGEREGREDFGELVSEVRETVWGGVVEEEVAAEVIDPPGMGVGDAESVGSLREEGAVLVGGDPDGAVCGGGEVWRGAP